jgi:hypothetical protein
MGREIRKVPVGWQHPKDEQGRYKPLYDQDFESAMKEWLEELNGWMGKGFQEARKKHPDMDFDPNQPYRAFIEWHGGPPDAEYYRPLWDETTRVCFQMYETVSEGTPVTPVFSSLDALEDHLVRFGTDWDRGNGWSRDAARAFCKSGFAPSLMVSRSPSGQVVIHEPRDGPLP